MAESRLTRQDWLAQKRNAKQRGIEFLFTYEEWRAWWDEALRDRPGMQRGHRKGQLAMCRIGDQGPYAVWNVYPGTHKDNVQYGGPRSATMLGRVSWLRGKTGADHPRSTPVDTPAGRFPSLTAAAEHYSLSRTELRRRLKNIPSVKGV